MTRQEMFDVMVEGLRARGWTRAGREVHWGFECRLRDPAGLPCAVGLLFSDDAYDERFEELEVRELLDKLGIVPEHSGEAYFAFLAVEAHDGGSTPSAMEKRFRTLGRDYGLVWPD